MSTFTAEQLTELTEIIHGNSRPAQLALERERVSLEKMRVRAEVLRMAKDTLVENRSTMPVESRAITAEEIQTFANTFLSFTDPAE